MTAPDDFEIREVSEDDNNQLDMMLAELNIQEQIYYPEHPQLTRAEMESITKGSARKTFVGENIIFGAYSGQNLVGFCWCIVYDPGTGLEAEIAELYVDEAYRGQGIGAALVQKAVEMFSHKGVSFACVWTRESNEVALKAYFAAGFKPTRQTVLVWYPEIS